MSEEISTRQAGFARLAKHAALRRPWRIITPWRLPLMVRNGGAGDG
jgi:hypothetical protein